jgi:hypothetical protein
LTPEDWKRTLDCQAKCNSCCSAAIENLHQG